MTKNQNNQKPTETDYGAELSTLQAENDALRAEIDQLTEQLETKDSDYQDLLSRSADHLDEPKLHPTAAKIHWLQEHCSAFTVQFNRREHKVRIFGTLDCPECGYYTTPIVRDVYGRGKPPYFIHPEDLTKRYVTQTFDIECDEGIMPAVDLIETGLPGDVELGADPVQEFTVNARPFIQVSDLTVEDFQASPETQGEITKQVQVR